MPFLLTTILILSMFGRIRVRYLSCAIDSTVLCLHSFVCQWRWLFVGNNPERSKCLLSETNGETAKRIHHIVCAFYVNRQIRLLLKSVKLFHQLLPHSISIWTLVRRWQWIRQRCSPHWKRHRLHLCRIRSLNKSTMLKFTYHRVSLQVWVAMHLCHFEWATCIAYL